MVKIQQNRKQGHRLESLMRKKKLSTVTIAKKLGTNPRMINLIIWGERKDAAIREGVAMVLGYPDWKSLSAFVEKNSNWTE